MTTPKISVLLALATLVLAGGCSDLTMNPSLQDQLGPFPSLQQDGIVFVGIDTEFAENVFVMDAGDPDSTINLTINQTSEWPTETDGGNGEYYPGTLLAATAPYGVPSPDGHHVAFVTVPQGGATAGIGRVSLATDGNLAAGQDAMRTSPSIEGLERVAFAPTGSHLILSVVDPGSGDTTLQVMDLELNVVNDQLGPAAVTDLQYVGRGRTLDTILVTGVRADPGLAAVWEVPVPDGDVELLTAGLARDVFDPSISPDDPRFLAAELFDENTGRTDVAVYTFPDDEWTVITDDPLLSDFEYRSPRWERSFDQDNRLAFMQFAGDPDEDLTLLCLASEQDGWDLDVHNPEKDLDEGRRLGNPRWHPDGGRLLLDYRKTDNTSGFNVSELVVYDVGPQQAQLLSTEGEPELAHWSHDGASILLWDRSVENAGGDDVRTPIRLYRLGTSQTLDVVISPGDDPILYVEYPVFLYGNTLWY